MSGVCDCRPIKPDLWDAEGGVFPYLTNPITSDFSSRLRLLLPPLPSWLLPLSLLWGVSLLLCSLSFDSLLGLGIANYLCHSVIEQIIQLLINTLLFLSLAFHRPTFLSPAHALCTNGCAACVKRQSDWGRPQMPALDLDRWYQEVMAAGETNQLCPPPLPAKAFSSRKPVQVTAKSSAVFHLLLLFHIFILHLHRPHYVSK